MYIHNRRRNEKYMAYLILSVGNSETVSLTKIFCRAYIIYDSRWEWCKKQALRPSKRTVNERKA